MSSGGTEVGDLRAVNDQRLPWGEYAIIQSVPGYSAEADHCSQSLTSVPPLYAVGISSCFAQMEQ